MANHLGYAQHSHARNAWMVHRTSHFVPNQAKKKKKNIKKNPETKPQKRGETEKEKGNIINTPAPAFALAFAHKETAHPYAH